MSEENKDQVQEPDKLGLGPGLLPPEQIPEDAQLNGGRIPEFSIPEDTKIQTTEALKAVDDVQTQVFKGLAAAQASNTIHNMEKLAPLDKFEIGGQTYTRKKMKRAMLRELRKQQRQFNLEIQQIDDEELLQDRIEQMLFYKANFYFGMTQEQFEETDIEMLQTVIQATELRSNGFRRV